MEKDHHTTDSLHKKRGSILAMVGAGVIVACSGIFAYSQFHPEQAGAPTHPERSIDYEYPLHENITATVFWAGEDADSSNDFIHNRSSAWMADWVAAYGGIDHPEMRCGYVPCDFTPKENPFYIALPFSDYTEKGMKPIEKLRVVPWYEESIKTGESLLKNRWIEVTYKDSHAYAQWEDVGPFESDDAGYVFGTSEPKSNRAGLDMSPALADYLGIEGRAQVSWRFIDATDVPAGEWTKIITRSGPKF